MLYSRILPGKPILIAHSDLCDAIRQQMTEVGMTSAKAIGTYIIALLYFLFGLLLSFAVPVFGKLYAKLYGDAWRPEQNALITPFFWPAHVWALCFGLCALLLCLTARLSPPARRRVNIGAWIVLIVFALNALNGLYGFIFCHEWGCSRILPL
jgi:uncharacterized BrkB/YihY/UPF0761 family membrane protein